MRARFTLSLLLLAALPPGLAGGAAEARALPRPPHPPQTHRPAQPSEQAVFGPVTHGALLAFQRAYELPATGIADQATFEALERPFRGVLKPGMRGKAVAGLQAALEEKAFWPERVAPIDAAIASVRPLAAKRNGGERGPVAPPLPAIARLDGAYGVLTTRAVKAFQAHAGLARSGVADRATLAALGLKGTPIRPGERGRRVLRLQHVLVSRGFWGR